MNFVENRKPSGNLINIRVQHIGIENLIRLISNVPYAAVVSVAKSWPAPNNEAARFRIGKCEFVIETSFADMFIAPSPDKIPSEEFETLAQHLRIAKEKYQDSLP